MLRITLTMTLNVSTAKWRETIGVSSRSRRYYPHFLLKLAATTATHFDIQFKSSRTTTHDDHNDSTTAAFPYLQLISVAT